MENFQIHFDRNHFGKYSDSYGARSGGTLALPSLVLHSCYSLKELSTHQTQRYTHVKRCKPTIHTNSEKPQITGVIFEIAKLTYALQQLPNKLIFIE